MRRLVILLMIGIWIGLLLGISFLEAPLKFQAPGITTILGLGIGKLVFNALNGIEIFISIVLMVLVYPRFIRVRFRLQFPWVLLYVILYFQSFVLLPVLNDRVSMIVSGQDISASYHHLIYIICEISKLVLLVINFFKIEILFKHIYPRKNA